MNIEGFVLCQEENRLDTMDMLRSDYGMTVDYFVYFDMSAITDGPQAESKVLISFTGHSGLGYCGLGRFLVKKYPKLSYISIGDEQGYLQYPVYPL